MILLILTSLLAGYGAPQAVLTGKQCPHEINASGRILTFCGGEYHGQQVFVRIEHSPTYKHVRRSC